MPTATPPTAPATPVSVVPTVPVFVVLVVPASAIPTTLVPTIPTTPILTGPNMFSSFHPLPYFFIMNFSFSLYGFSHCVSCSLLGPVLIASSQFEVCGNFATVPNPMSEAVALFTCFDQPKVNDLDLADF